MIVQFWIKTRINSITTTFFVDGRKHGWQKGLMKKCKLWRKKSIPANEPAKHGVRIVGFGRAKWDKGRRGIPTTAKQV